MKIDMKKIFNYLIIISLFCACQNSKDYRDVLFMTGTEDSNLRNITVSDEPTDIAFSVSASTPLDKSVEISLAIDSKLIDQYNLKYNKNYKILPEGAFELSSKEVVIEEDRYISDPLKLTVWQTEDYQEGVTYALPIKIQRNSGGIDILNGSSYVLFIIKSITITQAASLTNNYFAVDFASQNDVSLKALPSATYETRIYVNNFQQRNPYISSVMGLEENFLLRFGDASIKPNQLQIAKPGLTSSTQFSEGKWYHIAAVFDNGEVRMYINGKLETSGTHSEAKVLDLTKVYSDKSFMIGRSANGRGLDGYISECRVWSKALSPAELANNVCYVDPTSEGLISYWRFDTTAEDGKTVTDITGHGYDAKGGRQVSFTDGVKCPDL